MSGFNIFSLGDKVEVSWQQQNEKFVYFGGKILAINKNSTDEQDLDTEMVNYDVVYDDLGLKMTNIVVILF